ncbi:MAG: hypothetical protein M1820_002595 [Bogoriella megaspora]|nr:MAG: hypothetical protein M1820_002595 [Bogoriella megaspora]
MHSLAPLALGLLATLVSQTVAAPVSSASAPAAYPTGPVVVTPGTAADIIITKDNTVNGTCGPPDSNGPKANAAQGTAVLPLSFVNHLGGGVNAYVTGADANNRLVMLQPGGTWYYPQASGGGVPQPITANVAIPLGGQGSTTNINLPGYISAGRIWFAVGTLQFFTVSGANGQASLVEPSAVNPSDPSSGVNWGFVELTNNAGGLYADISYVDFVGLPLGIQMQAGDGSLQSAAGLTANAVSSICSDLQAQAAKDGQPWGSLCQADKSGRPLRVIAPSDYTSLNPSAFSNLYTNYISQVWSKYSTQTLTINTQSGAGNVACKTSGNTLTCAGDNRAYAQPSAGDIFGCNSGPFAIQGSDNDVHRAVVPRLCAAFDRSTLLLNGGNVQPSLSSSSYYSVSPTNYFSKFVHKYEVDTRGYAFPYDDVNPAGEDQSGSVVDPNPRRLTVTVGGA